MALKVRRARSGFVPAFVIVGLLASGCGGSTSSGAVALGPDKASAADRGAAYLAERLGDLDPLHQSGIDYLWRNWGPDGLAPFGPASLEGIGEVLAGAEVPGDQVELRALARLADPSITESPTQVESLAPRSAAMAAGLYCDTRTLGPADLANWSQLISEGGYEATHVVLAWSWVRELGCSTPEVDAVGERATDRVLEEFNERMRTRPLVDAIDDLFLEQGAMLTLVGRADAIPASWFDAVVEAQQDDGGWTYESRVAQPGAPSNWHATFLALWALHGAGRPATEPMVLA
jgi:hypothetical protein